MNEQFRNLRKCIRRAPFGVLGLLVFVALPSTILFTDDYEYLQATTPWHSAFYTKFDWLLIPGVLVSCLMARFIPDRRTTLLFLFSALAIALSAAFAPHTPPGALYDGLLYWLRFVSVFTFAYGLTVQLGSRVTESLLYLLFVVLCGSAIFVYQLQFLEFRRIYASAMSVGSFAQVTVVVSLIAIARRQYAMLCLGVVFLVLTFSLTSTILFIGIASLIPLTSSGASSQQAAQAFLRTRARQLLLAGTVLLGFILLLCTLISDIGYDLDLEAFTDLHGRRDIWLYALRLVWHGYVGLFGHGFGRSADYFQNLSLLASYASRDVRATHFHSILFEGIMGLGILCLPPLVSLAVRIGQSWRQSRYLSCAILLFFLLSQTIDFTVYRPKEVVIWAFMLGLATGLARTGRSSRPRSQLSHTLRSPRTSQLAQTPALVPGGLA